MTRLVHIEIPYEARYLTEAQFEHLRSISFLPITKPSPEKEETEHAGKLYLYDAEKIVVYEDGLASVDFKHLIVRRQRSEDVEDLQPRAATVINKRIHVAVPGFGLMSIDDVKVETDLCTETLQGELDAGWRILAICPQPDQRRPDYVLGRTKSQTESTY